MSNELSVQESEESLVPANVASRSFIEAQTRGEYDIQISTAKRFPRSIKRFVADALSLATLDEETAASCFYSLPRDGKNVEGPSARLAEIVASCWGNMRSQANIVDMDDKFVTARGVTWDLEKNVAVATEVKRRITNKQGRKFSDDMIVTTSNAACSIALRNSVFKVVPMAFVRPVYLKAREVAIGDAQTLSSRRQKMVEYFGKMGIAAEKVCAKVGKASVEDVTVDDLAVLIGLSTAIKEGDTTVDEAFPAPEQTAADSGKSKTEKLADKVKSQKSLTDQPREPGQEG